MSKISKTRLNSPSTGVFIILFLTFVFWILLTKDNYFHWDEWGIFSQFKEGPTFYLLHPLNEHYIPLSATIHYFLFRFFGLNYLPFQIVLISLHTFNCYLLYRIVYRQTGDHFLATIGTILFAIASTAAENLVWSIGINITLAGTFAFLAYYFFPKHPFLSCLALFFSPLSHDLSLLYPLPFALMAYLRNKNPLPYLAVSLVSIATLFYFSHENIYRSVSSQISFLLPNGFAFITAGVVRGVLIRFFMPNLNFFPNSASLIGLYFRPVIFVILLIFALFFLYRIWQSPKKQKYFALILFYLPLIIIPYIAILPARVAQGSDQASIARYTYLPLFFLLVFLADIIKLATLNRKIIYGFSLVLIALHLISTFNFQTRYWAPIVSHDKSFSRDMAYLFASTDIIYNPKLIGINGQMRPSDLWYFHLAQKKYLYTGTIPSPVTDMRTKEIFYRLAGDYQKKYD